MVSEACKKNFLMKLDKIVVLKNPVYFKETAEVKKINKQDVKIAIIGRISAWKGQHEAVQIISFLRKNGYKVSLHIYGDHGENQDYFETLKDRIKNYGLDHLVFF